ncbi:hypothetical protein Pfo_012211 [Paulownia fortunei]|nr:hypothetical protein Pfo_012211 [Paulownia fortunei]
MSGEGPKLFTNKPKKSKLKASTPITMASASSTGAAAPPPPPPPPPPPQPQKESFVRRYRFLWPLLLVVNFTLGAYVLMRTSTKNKGTSEEEIPDGPTSSTSTSTAAAAATVTEMPVTPPIMEPVQRAPIPEDQQRELFKWMLEEKRKVKPRDAEEKKRIDEEKAILKQFIRAKSIPSL